MSVLDFERPIVELEKKIEELEDLVKEKPEMEATQEVSNLHQQLKKLRERTYKNLSAWQKTQIARHSNRFSTLDFVENAVVDFIELHGDRAFADDASIVGGIGKIEDIPFAIIGHQKGKNTKENVLRNFGMPRPEGYRKALRIMKLAEKFELPIVNFIDTPGAFPGIDAEERNQSEAIANNLLELGGLKTPSICVVLGEGGSGGALALAVTDVVMMMEHAIYSVISPEGCSSILWKSADKVKEVAESLHYTAQNLLSLGVIHDIIPEPLGGTHLNASQTAKNITNALLKNYKKLKSKTTEELLKERYNTYQNIGVDYIKNF
jgi:acetyl-CoA carboxylase carboxyl transferase subunit alpha